MPTLRHYFKIFLNILIPLAAMVLLLWLGPKLIVFFWPFVFGFLLAKLANPLVAFISEKGKVRRKAVSALVIVLVLAAVALLLYGIGGFLGRQLRGFIHDIPDMWEGVEAELSQATDRFTLVFDRMPEDVKDTLIVIEESLDAYISEVVSGVSTPTVTAIGNVAKHIPNLLIGLIMCFLSAYFLIADKDYVPEWMKKYVPQSLLKQWEVVAQSLRRSVGGYFKAQLKIEVWMYLLLYVGLMLAGTNYVALVALGIAFLDLLPIFGTGTVLVPWAVIRLIGGEYVQALILLCLWLVGQLLRQIIQPKIMGDSMGMPPIPTLFILYIGWRFSGVGGMIFALPVAFIIINLDEAGVFDEAKRSVRYLVRDINRFRRFTKEDEEFENHGL